MNIESNRETLRDLLNCFPEAFINGENEFIACPRINSYFRLDGIDEFELKCKILEYLSRPAFKGEYYVTAKANQRVYNYHLHGINRFLGTSFSENDVELIYTYLGNSCNRNLCEEFVRSGYDLQIIKDYEKKRYSNG